MIFPSLAGSVYIHNAMMKKRKSHPSPRQKRFTRLQRLDSAKTWLACYTGNKVVKAYRKHFSVDWQCAFTELTMLGAEIDPEYKKQVLQSASAHAEAKRQRKRARETVLTEEPALDQDEHFAFIAGYTPWGFPYGITWEEWEKMESE